MSASRIGPVIRGVALVSTLTGVVVVLWMLGEGTLALPSLRSWAALQRWYAAVGPEVATMALVRVLALVVAGWSFVGTLLELLAVLSSRSRPGVQARGALGWLADRIAPRSLQRLVHGLAGLSLTAGLAVVAPSAGIPAGSDPGIAVMHVIDGPTTTAVTGGATMRVIEQEAPPATPVPVAAAPVASAPEEEEEGVVVEPGESFWSISTDALTEALGRSPEDPEIAAHWRRLVAANRDRLVDPANPDLIYPGQTLVLPAP